MNAPLDVRKSPIPVDDNAPVAGACGRILVVDDERVNREMMSRLLSRHGYDCISASDGVAALELIETESVDLLLLDIEMPGMNGFAVLEVVRRTRSESELPVIMVTGNHDAKAVIDAFRDGANDYVTKPVDAGVMLARIGTHVKLKRAQAALQESEERYALAARGTNDGLWDWNLLTDSIHFSPRWKAMLELEDADVGSRPEDWFDLVHNEDLERLQSDLAKHLRGESLHFETELRMRRSDGVFRWMLCRGLAVRDENGTAQRIAGSLSDITEGKVADGLTTLPNRLLFLDRVQRAIDRGIEDPARRFAVLYLDIDNFKLVNDSLGHDVGDQLLVSIARRLESCVRMGESVVARMGGDEFTVLAENITRPEDAQRLAERILERLAKPFNLDGKELFASASIGITIGPSNCAKAPELLCEADTALYRAKASGKCQHVVFDPTMQAEVADRLKLEGELRRAIDRDELRLMFQPIVSLRNGGLRSFEALVRWEHLRLGVVSPANFIPLAEETGLIVSIGKWVLEEACRRAASWKTPSGRQERISISVNVSSRQLMHSDLVDDVTTALDKSGLPSRNLTLELTESAIMEKPEVGADQLRRLRALGVRIAIDDFGTGYSSLAYLHRLPLDAVKVDRSFVNEMDAADENRAIIRSIIALANSLDLEVVAEGVETDGQRRSLLDIGCVYGQGFLFSTPVDAGTAFDLIRAEDQRTRGLIAESQAVATAG